MVGLILKISEKLYRIKYILSSGKTITTANDRKKIIKEWEYILELPPNKIAKHLKLNKGKDRDKSKDVSVVEILLVDWAGNIIVNKVFEEVREKK